MLFKLLGFTNALISVMSEIGNYMIRRKQLQIGLTLSLLLFAACKEEYKLETSDMLKCRLANAVGYVHPFLEGSNEAVIYLDYGEGYMAYPQNVKFYTKDGTIYIKGDYIDEQECVLYAFEEKTYDNMDDSLRYRLPNLGLENDVLIDKLYAKASGYWTSDVVENEEFVDTYIRKSVLEMGLLATTEQQLGIDIYQPAECILDYRRPLVVMIHGGAFFVGDKQEEEYSKWCEMFARCGYVAVSINYRMGFGPEKYSVIRAAYRPVQDTRAAIRYMLKHSCFNIDPDRIYLAGCSAGAITALHTAFMTDVDRPSATTGVDNFDLLGLGLVTWQSQRGDDMGGVDAVWNYDLNNCFEPIHINAVANMWGAIFDPQMLRNSPDTRILSMHGIEDPVVPYGHGIPFAGSMGDLASIVLPMVNGSAVIDSMAHELGMTSKLITHYIDKHTLVKTDNQLNRYHGEFFDEMTRFFQRDMMDRNPIDIDIEGQTVYISDTYGNEIERCGWEVRGGIITEAADDDSWIKVLMFDDAPCHEVSACGIYSKIGVPFCETIEL